MAHLTAAVSEDTFVTLFETLRDEFHETASDSVDFGPFSASYSVGVRLEEGTVDLRNDGSIRISELDIVYDPLSLTLGIDIPKVCVGGFCILPTPFGCLLRVPRKCFFSADPDVSITLDLSGLIESEISGSFRIKTAYEVDPGRTPAMTDLDAEDAGVPNMWKLYLDPITLDLDLIDIADTVGNLLDAVIDAAVDTLLGFLPGWARDLVKAVLGGFSDLIRTLLDIGDDIGEWLSNLLGVSLGLFNFVLTVVADYFAKDAPIELIEDPFMIMDYDGPLIPVKVPIRNLAVAVNTDEMIITTDIGL